jgi:hypothetical protein
MTSTLEKITEDLKNVYKRYVDVEYNAYGHVSDEYVDGYEAGAYAVCEDLEDIIKSLEVLNKKLKEPIV